MKKVVVLFLSLSFLSCHLKQEKKNDIITVKQSEMAALMLEMYDVVEQNKKLVLEGEIPKTSTKSFFNIHTAVLTDPSDRNSTFKAYSDFYLHELEQLYRTRTKDSLEVLHNNVVNSCITCHQSTCIGPIPRIKKLLIR